MTKKDDPALASERAKQAGGLQMTDLANRLRELANSCSNPHLYEKERTMLEAAEFIEAYECAKQAEPVACLVGIKGSAFDLPTTKRAYTYAEQPGNVIASRLGSACDKAASQSAGDSIDRGLGLLQELQKVGFGVFDLGAEYASPPAVQVDSEFCNKCGRIHNLPIEVLARSSADDVAWGIDWGRSGDQTAVSIIKKLPDGSIEVVATEYGPPADDEAVRLRSELLHAKNCLGVAADQINEAVRLLREAKDYLDRWEARPSLQLAIDAYLAKAGK